MADNDTKSISDSILNAAKEAVQSAENLGGRLRKEMVDNLTKREGPPAPIEEAVAKTPAQIRAESPALFTEMGQAPQSESLLSAGFNGLKEQVSSFADKVKAAMPEFKSPEVALNQESPVAQSRSTEEQKSQFEAQSTKPTLSAEVAAAQAAGASYAVTAQTEETLANMIQTSQSPKTPNENLSFETTDGKLIEVGSTDTKRSTSLAKNFVDSDIGKEILASLDKPEKVNELLNAPDTIQIGKQTYAAGEVIALYEQEHQKSFQNNLEDAVKTLEARGLSPTVLTEQESFVKDGTAVVISQTALNETKDRYDLNALVANLEDKGAVTVEFIDAPTKEAKSVELSDVEKVAAAILLKDEQQRQSGDVSAFNVDRESGQLTHLSGPEDEVLALIPQLDLVKEANAQKSRVQDPALETPEISSALVKAVQEAVDEFAKANGSSERLVGREALVATEQMLRDPEFKIAVPIDGKDQSTLEGWAVLGGDKLAQTAYAKLPAEMKQEIEATEQQMQKELQQAKVQEKTAPQATREMERGEREAS